MVTWPSVAGKRTFVLFAPLIALGGCAGGSLSSDSQTTGPPAVLPVTSVAERGSTTPEVSGTFEGQLVTSMLTPLAGNVVFTAADGSEYPTQTGKGGMFLADLPVGEYTVTGRAVLADAAATPCTVTVGPVFVRNAGANGSVQLVCKP
jgi:hypothetical protein